MVRVFMDEWQFECCGESFAVGDRVEWLLVPVEDRGWFTDLLGSELAEELDFREEHHGGAPEGSVPTAGTVGSIRAAFQRYVPRLKGDRTRYVIPGVSRLDWLDRAEIPADDKDERFVGFLVELET